jgi:hypothetical protein
MLALLRVLVNSIDVQACNDQGDQAVEVSTCHMPDFPCGQCTLASAAQLILPSVNICVNYLLWGRLFGMAGRYQYDHLGACLFISRAA